MVAVQWTARQAITFGLMQAAGWSIGFVVMPWISKGGMG